MECIKQKDNSYLLIDENGTKITLSKGADKSITINYLKEESELRCFVIDRESTLYSSFSSMLGNSSSLKLYSDTCVGILGNGVTLERDKKDILATFTLESDCDYQIEDDSIRVYPHNDFHSKVDKLYQKIEEKNQKIKTKSKIKQPKTRRLSR